LWLFLGVFQLLLTACGQHQGASPAQPSVAAPRVSVLTHHYDNGRTGWNNAESILTVSAVSGARFGLLRTVPLDDQVDTQPLVVAGLSSVGGQAVGGHDVVYLTTETNTVYAIDGATGAVLVSRSLGAAVPSPQMCFSNGHTVGINGTGVIDPVSETLYVIAYTLENGVATYRLHALDITTLQDKVTSQVITASHALADGSIFNFNASVQRQRAALLLFNGSIYAGFASFCDFVPGQSRGWVLGWTANTLTPLAANQLTDRATGTGYYLSSIWMSGAGLAADSSNIYAVTGNSNPSGATYDAAGGTNFAESLIKLSPDLTSVVDWFTPQNYVFLEATDGDFGAGGVMLIPGVFGQGGASVALAAAAGKDGAMYLLNAGALGHGGPAPASPAPVDAAAVGYCWCAESYFVGANGPTIVSSGGGFSEIESVAHTTPLTIQLWSVPSTIPSTGPVLVKAGASSDLSGSPQDGGIFTSVSSHGPSNVVIWAVTRPTTTPDASGGYPMSLFAFSEAATNGQLTKLYQGVAGEWGPDSMNANANTVPVVANGQVYVATYKQLRIFGLH